MGSFCALRFDDISIAEQKSHVPDDFIYLFQEADRKTVQHSATEDEDESLDVGYFATRDVILHRLDIAGYTAERARESFEAWLSEQRDSYSEYGVHCEPLVKALQSFGYEDWLRRANDVLQTRYDFSRPPDVYVDEIDRLMRNHDQEWIFFTQNDPLMSIRAMLEALPDVQEVSLDISDLINAEWLRPDERICEARRAPGPHWRSVLQSPVIIAEGSTDTLVLKRSLQRIYPYLDEYITFFDYDGSKPDGGASYVVKFLRAFAAARINTPVLALFDNDAVGLEAFNSARALPLPAHMKATVLPDIELARSYPTLGPQGVHNVDINGGAVSIELFLGRHNITNEDGSFSPIVWGNSVNVGGVQRYQGTIQDKSGVLKRFLAETETHDSSIDYQQRFPELVTLWKHIFSRLAPEQAPSLRTDRRTY